LSVLDQLMAGSIDSAVTYETAVSLLGYTDSALLDEIVDGLAGGDGAAAYRVIERMVDSGHDPRRFVEDFLQTLRDLLIIAVAGDGAGDVLTSIPAERLDRMRHQAVNWGPRPLSRAADLTDEALRSMTGATSPRLQLELLIGRILVPTPSGQAVADMPLPGTVGMPGGGAPREHHGADYAGNKPIGVAPSASGPQAARAALAQTAQRASRPDSNQQNQPADLTPRAQAPSSPHRDGESVPDAPTPMPQQGSSWPDVAVTPSSSWDDSSVAQSQNSAPAVETEEPAPAPKAEPRSVDAASSTEAPARQTPRQNGGKQADIVRARWNEVLDRLASMSRVAWSLINTNAQLGAIDGSNLVLVFPSEGIMANFERGGRHQIVSDAIYEVTGLRYELSAQVGQASGGPAVTAPSAPASHHAYSDPAHADHSYSGQTPNIPLNNNANRDGRPDAGWVSEPPPFEHRVVQAPDVGSQALGDPAPRVAPDSAPHVGSDPVASDDPWGEVVIRTPHEDVEEPAQACEPEPQDGLSESQQVHNGPQPRRDDAWSAGADSASTCVDADPAWPLADSSPGFKVHSDSSGVSDDRPSDSHGDEQADSESLAQAEPVPTGGPVRRAMSVFTYDDFDPQNTSDNQQTTPGGWADAPVAQTNSVSFEDSDDTAQSAGDAWANGDNSAGSDAHNDGPIDDDQDSTPLDMGEDLPSMDDEDIETTTMVGLPVVLDVLGGKIIETIPNGSER
ncbi:MAG: DNA polymerase III subunit gamma/tau, partial [Actinomycetaceae bacterium UMB1218B]|nr:DNA polymerase III subunit gamma/tau [Actinomycetaceae bacterium UMB1218B]